MEQQDEPPLDVGLTPPRQPYQKPVLQVYGDLAEITQSMTGMMMNDGAGHPNRHYTS
jgi:hypothetical protein